MRQAKPITIVLSLLLFVTLAHASNLAPSAGGNSYHLFTKALKTSENGVVAVPSRYRWSVETSVRGFDLQGRPLPDQRVLLRLYDPARNFTALTAQMNLQTAEKLQRELADIIAKKRANPGFQHRPKLYPDALIPIGNPDAQPAR